MELERCQIAQMEMMMTMADDYWARTNYAIPLGHRKSEHRAISYSTWDSRPFVRERHAETFPYRIYDSATG
jgi:hypothetical protein